MDGMEIEAYGRCVTRNGTFVFGKILVDIDGGAKETVRVRFVSSKLKRVMHSGFEMEAGMMDALCTKWMDRRSEGRCPDADRQLLLQTLDAAECEVVKAKRLLSLGHAPNVRGGV